MHTNCCPKRSHTDLVSEVYFFFSRSTFNTVVLKHEIKKKKKKRKKKEEKCHANILLFKLHQHTHTSFGGSSSSIISTIKEVLALRI
jgi:hypothetical protein